MSTTTCPVYRPTLDEFRNFREYIKNIDLDGQEIGLVKIIPLTVYVCIYMYTGAKVRLVGWFDRVYDWEELKHIVIRHPIAQCVSRTDVGVYNLSLIEQPDLTVAQFVKFCEKNSFLSTDFEKREKQFWRSMGQNGGLDDPMYGADMEGSLFGDDPASSWNINQLDSPLQLIGRDLPGVTSAMLYFGSWRAMFAFHTEDMELYSINYIHTGSPKSWYSIPPKSRQRFENMAQSYFAEEYRTCRQFLRHKTTMISPYKLKSAGIPYNTIVQHAGEFVVTFPGGYHSGFNHGFNIAEATNFATDRWLREGVGRSAQVCHCRPYSVNIDIDYFETLFRREQIANAREQLGGSLEAIADLEGTVDLDLIGAGSGDGSWLLRCMCGKRVQYMGSASGAGVSEGYIFQCEQCGAWCHATCVYGSEAAMPAHVICHVCQRIEKGNDPSPDQGPDVTDEAFHPRKKIKKVGKRTPIVAVGDEVTVSVAPHLHHKHLGDYINITGKITDIDDNHIRVHIKNTRRSEDYWLSMDEYLAQLDSPPLPHHVCPASSVPATNTTPKKSKKPKSKSKSPRMSVGYQVDLATTGSADEVVEISEAQSARWKELNVSDPLFAVSALSDMNYNIEKLPAAELEFVRGFIRNSEPTDVKQPGSEGTYVYSSNGSIGTDTKCSL